MRQFALLTDSASEPRVRVQYSVLSGRVADFPGAAPNYRLYPPALSLLSYENNVRSPVKASAQDADAGNSSHE